MFTQLSSSYALERHLRRDEVIHPLQEVGKFRGESVFLRENVQRLRTADTWLHEGRVIQVGQQPLKRVAPRAHTINRKRALELSRADAPTEIATQGLYAEWQTELYIPDPVIDVSVVQIANHRSNGEPRGEYPKMTLAMSIYSCRPCCPMELYIFPV